MAVWLEEFARGLVRSGLLPAAELAAFREGLAPEKGPRDAQGLARELVRAGRLTKYQVGRVYRGNTQGLVWASTSSWTRSGVAPCPTKRCRAPDEAPWSL